MAKQTLGLELKQQQKLSPLQIQTIKLIELPIQELEQRIQKEIEENPVLEEDSKSEDAPKPVSLDEYKQDDTPSWKLHVNNWGRDERPEYNTFSVKESFSQTLRDQLGFCDLDPHQRSVADFIINSLDADGYLRQSLDNLVDLMEYHAGIKTDEKEVLDMLHIIQDFEPVGVGARDLRECMLIQLRNKKPSRDTENAIRIIRDYYDEFSNRHLEKIVSKLNLSADEFRAAVKKISHLNPAPGGQIDDSYNDQAQQIVPDFVMTYDNGNIRFEMPRFSIPELKVNKKYAEVLMNAEGASDKEAKEAADFVKKKLDSAKWFVEAIKQRHNTLTKTMQAIVDFQHDYFIDGDESNLRPMVLKDIAEITGFDISTISRVVNSKYIETHFGVYPLKYFFSEGLADQDGNERSTRELKKVLQQLVEDEDKRKPLTDDRLVELMTAKGYAVARRTIAKYRDQLNIPTARLRKEL
ncbi:MAG: RNA polymerase factor sigma-54 [Bacteroidales bacterium]|nr:RNA polymerase factor sigma-54 [Bacteroidales bacterium]